MEYILLALLAGILTILTPCSITLLPIIVGGSLNGKPKLSRTIVIIVSLLFSLLVFSLLLKASTLLIDVDPLVWRVISGGIILVYGVFTLIPEIWDQISVRLNLSTKSAELLQSSKTKTGTVGDILLGLSLGPVFSSCSPTFGVIIGIILPQDFTVGLINLIVYLIGLAIVLFMVAALGQRFVSKVKGLANPHGTFRKVLGIIFILVGLFIITGLDKELEKRLLDLGVAPTVELESRLVEQQLEN